MLTESESEVSNGVIDDDERNGFTRPLKSKVHSDEISIETQTQDSDFEENNLIKEHYESEIAKLKKEVEVAIKAKETIVMRYANSEKEVLKLKKGMEVTDKTLKESQKEVENLNKKNKMLYSERERLIDIVNAKTQEAQNLQKECEKLKDDVSTKDFKIKWTQNKLNSESEAHKETLSKLQKCEVELKEALDEAQKMRQDCQDMLNSYTPKHISNSQNIPNGEISQNSDESFESSDIPIVTNGENEVHENGNAFQKEIEKIKAQHESLVGENKSLSTLVTNLKLEIEELEKRLERTMESNAEHLHQIATLHSDLAASDSLRVQLQLEEEKVKNIEAEIGRIRESNLELEADMKICRNRESELLSYTQEVTEKNVNLQSLLSGLEIKCAVLDEEKKKANEKLVELNSSLKNIEKLDGDEKKILLREKNELKEQLCDSEKIRKEVEQKLDEARGEIILMKKRHEASLKEFNKELKVAMKLTKSDGISQGSRTSSSTSLNNMDSSSASQKSSEHCESESGPVIPDQQTLIEHIVKLQRRLAKMGEKNEVLQEQMRVLVEAVQKRGKIIQGYAMSQETGAMSSDISDQNKAEVVKHGGVMASLYSSKPPDESLTLELCLEINRKLQALLEDTLLKNITLKENLSTLGQEISKLTESNRKLQKLLDDKR